MVCVKTGDEGNAVLIDGVDTPVAFYYAIHAESFVKPLAEE